MFTDSERDKLMKLLRQPDPLTFSVIVLLTVCQFFIGVSISGFNLTFLLKAIFLGAPISHGLYILSLECANNLCFGHEFYDRSLSIFSNLTTTIPYAEFQRFSEAEHRAFCGGPRDPNFSVCSEVTRRRKLAYLAAYPLLIGHRWFSRRPIRLNQFMSYGILIQTTFNLLIWCCFGFSTLFYFFCSTYLAFCPLHPMATHLFFEHYLEQTRSYYGVLNPFLFNAGFHREKHHHPRVPWTKIHLIRQLYFFSDDLLHQIPTVSLPDFLNHH